MENWGYLFAAFIIVWAVLFAYLFILASRQRRLKRKVESLEEMLQKK